MRYILFLILLVAANLTFGQTKISETDLYKLDSLIARKLSDHRAQNSLPVLMESQILTSTARHHSEYMKLSTIVGHEELMDIPRFNNINNPRKRVAHYANYEIADDNLFGEICLGIPTKKIDDLEEAANEIFEELLKNNNRFLIEHMEASYLGLSTKLDKKSLYATVMIGIGYNNIVAVLEAKASNE